VLDGGETEFIKRISESMTKVNYKDGYKIIINLPRLLRILKELHVGYTDFDDRNHRYIPLEYKTTEELSKQINDQIKWVFKGMETEADFINIPICTIDD
jgi:hypothetical protein